MTNNTGYRNDLKFAYEQSINAYQQHVQRYGTWMNMYAIIIGALLVAFCSFYGTEKSILYVTFIQQFIKMKSLIKYSL